MACANGMVSLYKSSTGERIYRFQLEEPKFPERIGRGAAVVTLD